MEAEQEKKNPKKAKQWEDEIKKEIKDTNFDIYKI